MLFTVTTGLTGNKLWMKSIARMDLLRVELTKMETMSSAWMDMLVYNQYSETSVMMLPDTSAVEPVQKMNLFIPCGTANAFQTMSDIICSVQKLLKSSKNLICWGIQTRLLVVAEM